MKIVIDARLYGLEHAGPGRYVMNLVEELKLLDEKNQYVILLRKNHFNNFSTPKNWQKIEVDINHYTFAEQLEIPKIIKNIDPDIVHFPFINVPIFYFGKHIVTIHDMTMHKYSGGEATTRGIVRNKIWRFGYYLTFIKAVRTSKAIIVPSKFVKNEILDYYNTDKNKIFVTYEGVDNRINIQKTINLREKYGIRKPYFIYSGSAYPHKNLNKAIQSIKELNDEGVKIDLIVTGSRNIFMERIQKFVESLNAKSCIKIIGYVDDNTLANLFKNSLGFIYPTLSEGFGLPILEAMNVGTIGLSSNIKVLQEIYQDYVMYFDPKDTDSIKETIKKVLELSENERKLIINKGKSLIKKYSWEKMAQETIKVYKSLSSK